ncbi:DNA-processing protein DprA [Tropheryma whipplei]|uniref:Nucleotide-binding protein n=1 Tax=Tropheryma whipplei (strain Twist) TaxID=203267 RepID=Q83MV3_TROWT|nr:DNA-processing protein DprA [Tropheryma whipplei]AAO44550.1 nucleotide-binding protein [Tropheryma whipplei str. Twist]
MKNIISTLNLPDREVISAVKPLCFSEELSEDQAVDYFARAAWSLISEPGDRIAGRLISCMTAPRALGWLLGNISLPFTLDEFESQQLEKHRSVWKMRADYQQLLKSFQAAHHTGAKLVVTDKYNKLQDEKPHILWVRGNSPSILLDTSQKVSIVGTRCCSYYGKSVTADISYSLARKNYVIVSGGALGIDGTAHMSALSAGKSTIVFFAGGVDWIYPRGNEALFSKICESGIIVSEMPCGSRPTKWRFLRRNRLIAAIPSAVVVTEAAARSGSISTAYHAADVQVPVGAVPGPINSPLSEGCNRLIRDRIAESVTCADDVVGLFAPLVVSPIQKDSFGLQASRIRVIDALSKKYDRDISEICRLSGMLFDDVSSLMRLLELSGQVIRSGSGWRLSGRLR